MNKFAKIGVFILIFLNLLPGGFVRDTVDVGHFFSSVHMFEYALDNGFKFGVDIIDNVGPYGHLHYPYIYAGGAYGAKTFWFALICFVYAYYATEIAKRILTWPERGLFLFAVIFFPLQVASPWYSFEVIPRLAILFSAFYFLSDPINRIDWQGILHIVINSFFYAFISLEKASNFYFILLIIFILSAYWLTVKQIRSSLYLVCSYFSALAIFWMAAGQQLPFLLDYFLSISSFINAYQEILGQEMEERNFRFGLFYCSAVFILLIFRLWFSIFVIKPKENFPAEFFRTILVSALFFISWKQGMLRGNSSYGTLLYATPILLAYLCLYPIAASNEISEKSNIKKFSFWSSYMFRSALFTLLLIVIWRNVIHYEHGINHDAGFFQELNSRVSALVEYRPADNLEKLDDKFEKLKFENNLPPSLKKELQSGRVDEFGSIPEIILLNHLDYRPRPVPIDFVASNAVLNEKNGNYYQNLATAPDFVFIEEFGLRLSDSSAYLSLLFNYQAIATFKNYLVLKKRSSEWRGFKRHKLNELNANIGEWLSLDELQRLFLWVEIHAEPSLLGKIKRFLYKPDYLRLDIALQDGTVQSLPVSISQLSSGFLLNPIFQSKKEILMIGSDKNQVPWSLAKAFRISLNLPLKSNLFEEKIKIKFYDIRVSTPTDTNSSLMYANNANSLINLLSEDFPFKVTKFPLKLLGPQTREDFILVGMAGLEENDMESWRWALGPATRLKFFMDPTLPDSDRQLLFKFAFKNGVPIQDQHVTIRLNGKIVRHFTTAEITSQELTKVQLTLSAKKGENLLEISYHDWNYGKNSVGFSDPRKLAIVIMNFSLENINN